MSTLHPVNTQPHLIDLHLDHLATTSSSSPTTMRLPLELVESVVDHLSADVPSLKSCALTSSAFLATSQRQLFHTLVVTPPASAKGPNPSRACVSPTTKLYELLLQSPRLSKYIHHLRLEDVGTVTTDMHGVNTHWLAQDTSFALLLPLLPSVKSLIWHSGMCGLNWYTLPPATRQALQSAFAQWTLERFEATAMVNLPLPVIKSMKSLQHLSLTITHFVEKELPANTVSGTSDDGVLGGRPLRLKSLSIVDPSRHLMSTFTTWVVNNVDLSNLEELSWNTYGSYFPKGEDMVEILRLLEPASESIRTLEVVPSLDGTSTASIPSLSVPSLGYPKLESLTLGFELSPHNPSSSLWFKTSFDNVASSHPNLERIQVRCHIAQESPSTSFDPEVWGLQGALVHPVTGEMKAKRLKEVDVQLHSVYSVAKDEMGTMRGKIVDGMGSLPKRVRVNVTEPTGQA